MSNKKNGWKIKSKVILFFTYYSLKYELQFIFDSIFISIIKSCKVLSFNLCQRNLWLYIRFISVSQYMFDDVFSIIAKFKIDLLTNRATESHILQCQKLSHYGIYNLKILQCNRIWAMFYTALFALLYCPETNRRPHTHLGTGCMPYERNSKKKGNSGWTIFMEESST